MFFILIPTTFEIDIFIIPILQMRKLRPRATSNLFEGTELSKCLIWDSNSGSLAEVTAISTGASQRAGPGSAVLSTVSLELGTAPERGSVEEALGDYLLGEGRREGRGPHSLTLSYPQLE